MTTFILGHGNCAFTVGFGQCPQRGATLPFFAIGDADKIALELDMSDAARMYETKEGTRRAIEAFDKHGFVVFLDNYEATERFFGMMMTMINHAIDTSWVNRDMERETIQ